MVIPFNRWYNAIFTRRSRRQFINNPISTQLLEEMERICNEFKPFDEVRAILIKQPSNDIFKGFLGKYGKIKDAPSVIAFVGIKNDPFINEKIGYTGEGVILEATALGLSTCWVAGFFRPEIVSKIIKISKDERVFAVSPLGYSPEKWTFEEKLMTGFGSSHKRKPLRELLLEMDDSKLTIPIKTILEAARLAPSAVNRQPWRFSVESDGLVVLTDNTNDTFNISKRLDCGIAMLHMEVASLKCGIVKRYWEFFRPPKVAKLFLDI